MGENSEAKQESQTTIERLHEEHDLTRILLDATPLGAQFWDKDINVIACNQETIRLFNAPSKKEYLENFYKCFPKYQPDGSLSKEKSFEIISSVFETGYLRLEWMCQTFDGTPLPTEVTLVRVNYKGDHLIASYTRDLREQRRMLREIDAGVEKLKAAQLTMSAMFEANPHINVLFDSNFEIIDCNPAAVRFMGFETKEEMIAGFLERITKSVHPFQPNGQPSIPIAERFATAAKEGLVKYETDLILGGKERNVNVEFKRIPYEDSFAIVAYVFDSTEIHEREQELVRVREENELQLTKLNLVVQATKIGLWEMEIVNDDLTNPANAFIWSDEFRRMLGFTDETDFPNLLGSWSDRLHPEDKEDTLEHAVRHLMDKTGNTPYDKEYRLLKKNGEYGYFRAYGGTSRDEHGNALRIAGALMDITETKNTLINNELQLTKLNLVVQATKIGLWEMVDICDDVFNLQNAFLWSDDFRHLLGFTDETDFPNICKSWWERLHPEDKDKTHAAFSKHLFDKTGKTPFDIEYRLLKKEGVYAYYRATGETIRDEHGNPIRVAGALMDITEAKKMTEALNEAVNNSLKTIDVMSNVLNNSDGMIYVSDKETDEILFINDSLKQHFGITEDVIGQPCYKVFQTGKEARCEWCPCRQLDKEPNSEMIWEERNALTQRYYRHADRYIDWYDGTKVHIQHSIDLTDIKEMSVQLEAALEQANAASRDLMLQKATLQTIIDSIPDLIFCKDLEFRYTLLNASCIDYLNTNRDRVIGKNDIELGFPGAVTEKMVSADQQVFDGAKRVVYDDWIPSFDGIARYLETTKAPLLQDGTVVGVVGVSRDITEKMRMEKTLEAALAQAEAASKAKTDFLSKMSHEIRTPMNAILGITEIQLQTESLTPKQNEALNKIHSAGELLLNIINDILDLSKIEAGKLELLPTQYDVASLINDVVTINIMRIGSKSVEFKLLVDENIPATLFGDELRIKQILNNLLSNAFKYTLEGSVKLSIFAEAPKESEPVLVFEVRDTGLGMTGEQVDRLFEEYTRFNLKANRATEGTGLGMNITHNLVRMMNGTISVESEPDKGSVFIVRLPQEKVDSGVLGRELADNLENFRAVGTKQMKMSQIIYESMSYGSVLIVDDVESNLYVATGLLSPYGLSIETAESGYAAIDKIKEGNTYDVIFMDHMMPGMDGIETTKVIRSMGYDEPIVALTANALAGQADMFYENGFDGFVSKPIDVRHLNTVLKKYVRDKQTSGIIREAERQRLDQEQIEKEVVPPSVSPQLIEFFLQDAHKTIAVLNVICEKRGKYSAEDIRTYVTSVHGIKSALGYVGESELSAFAGKLERAGRENDTTMMSVQTPVFMDELRAVIEKLTPSQEKGVSEATDEDHLFLREKLISIKSACENFDKKTAKAAIVGLRQKKWRSPVDELLGAMAEDLLNGDFEKVAHAAEKITACSCVRG